MQYPYPEQHRHHFRPAFYARAVLAFLILVIIIVCCYCKLISPPEHDFSDDMELWTHDFNCEMRYEPVTANEAGHMEYKCATLGDRHIEFTVEWRMKQCQLGPNGPKMPYYEPASNTDFALRLNEYWSREYGTLNIAGKSDTDLYYEAALIIQEHIRTFRFYCGARLWGAPRRLLGATYLFHAHRERRTAIAGKVRLLYRSHLELLLALSLGRKTGRRARLTGLIFC